MSIQGKKIILAVTGSIAAYKTPQLVRQFLKCGAEIRVVITPSAADFVSPLSLSTVSKNPVLSEISNNSAWNNHVELGLWADAMVVAPCSANTLSKLANGICDNLVCAVYLSARCPVFIAPAMDEDMYLHPSTQENLKKVSIYGNKIIPAGHGELASGLTGTGRMAEPEQIIEHIVTYFSLSQQLSGIRALVTAGPTYEKIDPVRFIGNFSSGKMGIAIAEALADRGAIVDLILGPTRLFPEKAANIHVTHVVSAQEMFDACERIFPFVEIAVMAAAVADYTPATVQPEKIKKSGGNLQLTLTKTKDILAHLGTLKAQKQTLVGFALETNNEVENAATKLKNKNADMIVLNSLRDNGAGFGHDTNKISIITLDGHEKTKTHSLPLMTKKDAAIEIINYLIELRHGKEHVD